MNETLFDLADFEADVVAAVYAGPAPLTFTQEYFTPAQLIDAARAADRGSHTWREAITLGDCGRAPGHSLFVLSTDLRCKCWLRFTASERADGFGCFCPGDLVYQANCVECRWHVIGSEPAVVEAWHDHAWPGWRDLPIIPLGVRPFGGGLGANNPDRKAAARGRAWVAEHYPASWQVDGAPVRTERNRTGTRHVPGYSPWGGFDLCAAVSVEAVAA